jgi:hypothetical protein
VSQINTNRTTAGMAAIGVRAKGAAAQAVPLGKRAGTTAVQGARQGVQGAMEWTVPRVQVAVLGARGWAAPRLEGAADAVTTTVAPKVSTALRAAANQVRPTPPPAKTGLRRLLDWRWLLGLGAVAAAAGTAAAATMRHRYASATAAAKEGGEPDPEAPADGSAADPAARSEVNGQVTTPRK